jgi:predicted Zn finger-like uncharacterized protein
MRLVCPNCGAQYEIDDQLIPEGGRDVQCSNCGHAWFQKSLDEDDELADELGLEPEIEAYSDDGDDAIEEPAEETGAEPARRELNESLRDMLREEAQREIAARAHEREQIETQPELGLDETKPESRRNGLRERMAQLRGLDEDEPGEAVSPGPRRELLPDIEEINSSLDSTGDYSEYEEPTEETTAEARSGFRRGFITMIVLAVALVALYNYTPMLSERYPQLKPHLAAYVDLVDSLRAWLDGLARMAISKMRELSAG